MIQKKKIAFCEYQYLYIAFMSEKRCSDTKKEDNYGDKARQIPE